ncbi:isochorismatase family protein [Marinobacter sp. 1_MG-2023]|uniref:isochorismatase family protein n=1 Tax=Marinobacter sp. 1_MG-2023 TaxID=3062627 RepID=UPI0026E1274B|nr:isochorismatase family protein [Marinobacter sp. 1_MG-2023]MDO6825043.1 isochorismatase family protein [Marinobacter sp. 1_MG-2023]
MLMKSEQSTLLLIDVQEKLMPAIAYGAEVIDRCTTLATIAGLLEIPVLATEQLPEKLGPNAEIVKELCDQTIAKYHFDACPDGLVENLPEGRQHIIIAGCETHVCMMQTALSLIDAGYKVWVVADATGSRNEFDRDVALDRLSSSGARIVTVEMVAFEWMRHCKHPAFRDVQALIK